MKGQKNISYGGSKYVILVYGNVLKNGRDSDFYKRLEKDYSEAEHCGGVCRKDCPWVYVNLKNKTFFPGLPFVKITTPLNDHAVTIEEFYKILEEYKKAPEAFYKSETVRSIYEKYRGKEPFVFKEHRFDSDEGYEESLKLIEEKDRRQKEINDRTLYFLHLDGITAIVQGNDFIIPKEKLFWIRHGRTLPDTGIYKALFHQQGVPGEEWFDCQVEFSAENLKIIDMNQKSDCPDLMRDLRIWKNSEEK